MKRLIILIAIIASSGMINGQVQFTDLYPENVITDVQPMTGIVFWNTSGKNNSDAISLEFSYMLFNDIVTDSGVYNWDPVEERLNAIASRNHQAIFRFRYVYPGYETSVPDYILNRTDYDETVGLSEGRETHFPDWTNKELQRFTLEFYTKFAERYDQDPRLAFIQVGFGLWAEYHIYSGPFTLGKTFPDKDFQEAFFYHLDSTFRITPWSISIDAADDTYTPFVAKPELKNLGFGVFDDSFMHKDHAGYNTSNWNFFDRERFKIAPAGGEFSYYSDYDQEHVLDYPDGPYGKRYELFAEDFHITYIMGNDQPGYQSMERIKQASMASGYRFKIVSLKTAADTSVFEITNYGVAPIYYDAYLALNGIRSPQTLKYLAPGDTIVCAVDAGAENAEISIECDKTLGSQTIQFYGTQDLPASGIKYPQSKSYRSLLYPNPAVSGQFVYSKGSEEGALVYNVYDLNGKLIFSDTTGKNKMGIDTSVFESGLYIVKLTNHKEVSIDRLIVL